MCCESCPRYEECAINGHSKDECCKKCPDWIECAGAKETIADSYGIWQEEQ